LRRAEEFLRYSEKLAERGYVSEVQLEADEFAVQKARKELDVAHTKLNVLQKFTKKKMETQLQANIDTARARLRAREKTWELDKVQQAEIEEQVKKCVIRAPSNGQVVYANDANRRSSSGDLLIDEGRPVRERQVIVRLPDPSKMRVVTKVHESRISNLKLGLSASIILDAFNDDALSGKVVEISEYPLPSVSSYTAHIKEYEVQVEIAAPPIGLRPGMSAEVTVTVEKLPEATQVPIQAVLERNNRFFCAMQDSTTGRVSTREIKIGSVNDETAVVLSGLTPSETVILSPYEIESKLDLPDKLGASTEGTGEDS
jgi:HlyD family secretion protein